MDCQFENERESCWGEVTVVDEFLDENGDDCRLVYACEGHADVTTGGKYKPDAAKG